MVPGEGPVPSPGMIIGEAPGRREVLTGRPFIGPSGRLLFTFLGALGVKREQVYVTNVVKEMPQDSSGKIRRPFEQEVQAWMTLLNTEILNVAPHAILLLGKRTAVRYLAPDLEPGEHDELYYAAWHPAHLLYGGDREAWLEQLRPWAEALGRFEYA